MSVIRCEWRKMQAKQREWGYETVAMLDTIGQKDKLGLMIFGRA